MDYNGWYNWIAITNIRINLYTDQTKDTTMKQIYIILTLLLSYGVCAAQQVDSIKLAEVEGRIVALESGVSGLAHQNDELQGHIMSLSSGQSTVNGEIAELKSMINNQEDCLNSIMLQVQALKRDIDSINVDINTLDGAVDENAQQIASTSTDLDAKIVATDSNAKAQATELSTRADGVEKSIKNKSVWGVIALALVFAVLLVLSILLHRKGEKSIESLKQSANKLNEEIIGKASVEISEMQKIAASIGALSAAGASSDSEQQLIKTLADRITFMEMTLYKMDSSVKGHKTLVNAISQMKNNMQANGYVIVSMLGTEYIEGTSYASVSFVDNDEVPAGKRIITKVIKPQIDYKGVMIQAAQIEVSQNL